MTIEQRIERAAATLRRWQRALREAEYQRTKPDWCNKHRYGRNLPATFTRILRRRKERERKCARRIEQATERLTELRRIGG